MMFELRTSVEFPAAHHLVGYPGDCARPHGHNWRVEIVVQSAQLDSVGMAVDFRKLKSALKEITSQWDHQDLNQQPAFKGKNPSAEVMAQVCFDFLKPQLNDGNVRLERVIVWENDRCCASYFEG